MRLQRQESVLSSALTGSLFSAPNQILFPHATMLCVDWAGTVAYSVAISSPRPLRRRKRVGHQQPEPGGRNKLSPGRDRGPRLAPLLRELGWLSPGCAFNYQAEPLQGRHRLFLCRRLKPARHSYNRSTPGLTSWANFSSAPSGLVPPRLAPTYLTALTDKIGRRSIHSATRGKVSLLPATHPKPVAGSRRSLKTG